MDLDTNPSIDGFLLNFLKKCKRIRVFLFSGVISLATLEAIYKLQKEGVTGKINPVMFLDYDCSVGCSYVRSAKYECKTRIISLVVGQLGLAGANENA